MPPSQDVPWAVLQVLTRAGFKSTARERRGSGWVSEAALNHKRQQKLDRLHKTTHDLVFAWGLSLLCGLGHLGHVWPAAPGWLHALHHPLLAGALSAAALLGEWCGRCRLTACRVLLCVCCCAVCAARLQPAAAQSAAPCLPQAVVAQISEL